MRVRPFLIMNTRDYYMINSKLNYIKTEVYLATTKFKEADRNFAMFWSLLPKFVSKKIRCRTCCAIDSRNSSLFLMNYGENNPHPNIVVCKKCLLKIKAIYDNGKLYIVSKVQK